MSRPCSGWPSRGRWRYGGVVVLGQSRLQMVVAAWLRGYGARAEGLARARGEEGGGIGEERRG